MGPSPSQVILEAIRLATEVDIEALQELTATFPDILKLELVLRILLSYLPESVEPLSYVDFLRTSVTKDAYSTRDHRRDAFHGEISEEEANRQLRSLHLLALQDNASDLDSTTDPLSCFLVSRARRIDAETGNLSLVKELIEPFLDHSPFIRIWAVSTLLPLLRLNYERSDPYGVPHTLESFEMLRGGRALDTMLSVDVPPKQETMDEGQTGKDLRALVGPWMTGEPMRKRRKTRHTTSRSNEDLENHRRDTQGISRLERETQHSEWSIVNKWLLKLSATDLPRAAQALGDWSGPEDVNLGDWGTENIESQTSGTAAKEAYLQTGLSIIYSSPHTTADCYPYLNSILSRVTDLASLFPSSFTHSDGSPNIQSVEPGFLSGTSPSNLDPDRLQTSSNPLTIPSIAALDLATALLWSAQQLENLGYPLKIARVAQLCLFDSSEDQQKEFSKLVRSLRTHGVKDDTRWTHIRYDLLRLRCWTESRIEDQTWEKKEPLGIFSRIGIEAFETEILQAFLSNSRYKLATETFCSTKTPPISSTLVHNTAVSFAFASYDSASNGNMTRGGVKKARETLAAFQPYFPDSLVIKSSLALISATHALSFYSLTLQHGIPFQPVNIRVHADPVSLISKVLDQNPRSYTKLEDLLDIGRNLVKAGFFRSNGEKVDPLEFQEERQLLITERRIVAMTISASLAEKDFDTAYSYIVNRLSLAGPSQSQEQVCQIMSTVATPRPEEDITWKAAYQAGRAPLSMGSGPSELRRLEQRMELLSQALLLAPITAVGEILDSWKACEEEMNSKATHEVEVEKKWDEQGSQILPGNFALEDVTYSPQKPRDMTRNALNEEAPIGLFDVARGAASALSRSAFPLRSPQSGMAKSTAPAKPSPASSIFSDQDGREGEGRVRKRDVVSNMVTGGLVSGIGWVLGAPPKE